MKKNISDFKDQKSSIHLLFLWNKHLGSKQKVINLLANDFKIIKIVKIIWTEKYKVKNYNRLFSADFINNNFKIQDMENTFECIIFEDNKAKRGCYSVDGTFLTDCNTNIVDLKNKVYQDFKFDQVYFSYNTPMTIQLGYLLFSPQTFINILDHNDDETLTIEQDLAGANEWPSLVEFFEVMNNCSKYVVLRNFEFLPYEFVDNDKDIDVLTDDVKKFALLANARKRSFGTSGYEICVNGEWIPLDIRYIGDNYYDSSWEHDMLNNSTYSSNNIKCINDLDYFFSLLYHCKVQKLEFNIRYVELLNRLAMKIGLENYGKNLIYDDEKISILLYSYLNSKKYEYVEPIDRSITLNRKFIAKLLKYYEKNKPAERKALKFLLLFYKLVPSNIKALIPSKYKQQMKNST
ncbi:hypothetical protein ACFPA1_10770 [Neobacillus sp. GCM10023253]|uniref:hypothetical protein n=1 Tax=Neobacillus sp. GCM10023253 TaxID=3252644 RepID=UPI00360A8287